VIIDHQPTKVRSMRSMDRQRLVDGGKLGVG
jgi:hypothetical protein